MNVLTAIKFIVRAWRKVSSETIRNCFQHTQILPVVQDNNEEPTIDNNDDNLMKELYADVEALHFQNMMNLEEYIDHTCGRIVNLYYI